MGDTRAELTPAQAETLHDVLRRAEAGDAAAVPAVRRFLAVPAVAEQLTVNVAEEAVRTTLAKFWGKNLLQREATLVQMAALRAEVAGPDPTAVEKLLAERVVTCWLHLHCLEAEAARKDAADESQSTFFQKAVDRAQKRYLSAIQTLAVVRKLAVPVLQFNIARRQVNVAAGHAVAVPTAEADNEPTDAPPPKRRSKE